MKMAENEPILCGTCGIEIHKDEETAKMETLFADVWRDKNGMFGIMDHWHDPKPEEKPSLWEIKHGVPLSENPQPKGDGE